MYIKEVKEEGRKEGREKKGRGWKEGGVGIL